MQLHQIHKNRKQTNRIMQNRLKTNKKKRRNIGFTAPLPTRPPSHTWTPGTAPPGGRLTPSRWSACRTSPRPETRSGPWPSWTGRCSRRWTRAPPCSPPRRRWRTAWARRRTPPSPGHREEGWEAERWNLVSSWILLWNVDKSASTMTLTAWMSNNKADSNWVWNYNEQRVKLF